MAIGKNNIPGGKKEYHEIRKKRKMLLVPYLDRSFIRQNNITVTFMRRQLTFCEDQFFITKNNAANSCQTWFYAVYFRFHFVRITVKPDLHQGPWPDKRHVAGKNINDLW